MNITLNIEAGNPAELQEAIVGLAGIVGFVTDGATINVPDNAGQEKPKRASRSTAKTDKPTAKQEEEQQEDAQAEQEASVDVENGPDSDPGGDGGEEIPTDVELRAVAAEIGKRGAYAKKAIKALLEKYGVPNITAVPNDKRIAFKRELEEL